MIAQAKALVMLLLEHVLVTLDLLGLIVPVRKNLEHYIFQILNSNTILIPILNKMFYHKDRTCPDDCSGQGTCDASTGTCTCNTGFTGANCAGKE